MKRSFVELMGFVCISVVIIVVDSYLGNRPVPEPLTLEQKSDFSRAVEVRRSIVSPERLAQLEQDVQSGMAKKFVGEEQDVLPQAGETIYEVIKKGLCPRTEYVFLGYGKGHAAFVYEEPSEVCRSNHGYQRGLDSGRVMRFVVRTEKGAEALREFIYKEFSDEFLPSFETFPCWGTGGEKCFAVYVFKRRLDGATH